MTKVHHLQLSKRRPILGITFIECPDCDYKVAADVDDQMRIISKIKINVGDVEAMHVYEKNKQVKNG